MWLLLLLAGCPTVEAVLYASDSGDDPNACLAVPVISTTPVQSPQVDGEDVFVDLDAWDYDGLVSVTVLFRPEGLDDWRTVFASKVGGEEWQAVIRGFDLHRGTVEYYGTAEDSCGDGACSPVGCESAPLEFEVVEVD
jgi:hypothetical protein